MQRIKYSVAHIDSIEIIENPFADPRNVFDHVFRNEVFKIKEELIDILDFGIIDSEDSKDSFVTFKVHDFLKGIPDRFFKTLKEIGVSDKFSVFYEAKLKYFYFNLSRSAEFEDDVTEYFWQRAYSKTKFKEFASIFS